VRPKKISDKDILEVARQCLMEQGTAVSTQYIADRLGVSQATLFKRFGTKIKLLKAALSLPIQANRMLQKIEAPPTQAPVKEQLLEMSFALLQFFDEMIPCWSTLQAAGIKIPQVLSDEAPPVRARVGMTKWMAQLQDQGKIRQNVEPESIALALIGALQQRPVRKHIIKDIAMSQTDKEYVESIVDVMWRGLSTEEKS
jgi:AcrR family transcriptional regulator